MTTLKDLILATETPEPLNDENEESPDGGEEFNEKTCEVTYVQWIDSASYATPWSSPQDIAELEPIVIHTVGFVVNETDEFITLVNSLADDAAGGDVTIPKVAVRQRRPV